MSAGFTIRPAQAGDEETIVALLWDFAVFEQLTHTFKLTREVVARDFFGANARVQCDVAEREGAVVGLMISYRTYGTFPATQFIFLEDIYVRPEFRRRGIGRAFLKHLAQRALQEGLPGVDWIVLNWNTAAIGFYRSLGANLVEEWQLCRLRGDALEKVARAGD